MLSVQRKVRQRRLIRRIFQARLQALRQEEVVQQVVLYQRVTWTSMTVTEHCFIHTPRMIFLHYRHCPICRQEKGWFVKSGTTIWTMRRSMWLITEYWILVPHISPMMARQGSISRLRPREEWPFLSTSRRQYWMEWLLTGGTEVQTRRWVVLEMWTPLIPMQTSVNMWLVWIPQVGVRWG